MVPEGYVLDCYCVSVYNLLWRPETVSVASLCTVLGQGHCYGLGSDCGLKPQRYSRYPSARVHMHPHTDRDWVGKESRVGDWVGKGDGERADYSGLSSTLGAKTKNSGHPLSAKVLTGLGGRDRVLCIPA